MDKYPMGSSLIALAVVAVLILLAMILIINFKQWKTTFILIFLYVFSLAAVWGMELLSTLFLLIGIMLLIACILKEPNLKADYLSLVYPAGILVFIVSIGFAFFVFHGVKIIPDTLQNQSKSLRENLSENGFYETLYGGLKGASETGRASTGLRENDSSLGGPVYQNNSLAFSVTSPEPHYWRVASRDVYTGTGWATNVEVNWLSNYTQHIGRYFNYEQLDVNDNLLDTPYDIVYSFPKQSPIFTQGIPLPTGNVSWNVPDVFELGSNISFDHSTLRLYFSNRPSETSFQFEYIPDSISEELLKSADSTTVDSDLYAHYTQLPSALPNRVRLLSEELTKDKGTTYEKVKAIESYLKQDGKFTYSLEDAPFTPEGKDYVDYFLFDSKIGYCEQFSSSMVVMLRSIGIPARWAKGFSTGSVSSISKDGTPTYTIRNRNAHAWPEVYFNDIGWIDFEPTPSFSLNETSEDASDESTQSTSSTESSSSSQTSSSVSSSNSSSSSSSSAGKSSEKNSVHSIKANLSKFIYSIRFVLYGFVIFALVLVWVFRKELFWLLFSTKVNRSKSFKKIYLSMLRGLNLNDKRHPNETLQAYIDRLTWKTDNEKKIVVRLTETYEQIVYGNDRDTLPTIKQRNWFKRIARSQRVMKK